MAQKFKKVIIIHQGALGDLINTVPAIQALKENSEFLLGIGSERLKLLEHCGIIEQAILSESISFYTMFQENFEPSPKLREIFSHTDLVISWLGRNSETYRKNLHHLSSRVYIFQEKFPPLPGSEHITKILAKPVLEAGIEIKNFCPRLSLPGRKTEPEKTPLILVHPGSGSQKKALPLTQLFQILEILVSSFPKTKLGIILGEQEKTVSFELVKRCPQALKPFIQIITDLPLLKLAELLSQAQLYLGMDSGATHLASALGIKTIALFGPTDPRVWGPPQENVKIIASKSSCAPCPDEQRRACLEPKCISELSLEEIRQAIKGFIK